MRPVHDVVGGPEVQPGVAVELVPGVSRLTAPNPGMMTGPGTNTYLVGTTQLAVVDPGPDDESHLEAIVGAVAGRGSAVRWILVTHTHRDHSPAAAGLAARTGATVIGFDARDGFSPDQTAQDGWTLRGPDFTLRAVHTPGHASNHLCWLVEEPALLLSGDHVMQGSTVVIRPPDGNMATYLANLRRLLVLQPEVALIGPGHGRMIVDPAAVVNDTVAHRLEREQVVLAALRSLRYGTVEDLVGTVYADVNDERKKVARHSLLAHLLKLAEDGQVRMLDEPPATGALATEPPTTDSPTTASDSQAEGADEDQVKEPRLLAVWEAVGRPGT